ncbi:restriction endonuclease subunit S [Metallibacterium sp.]|jgi:type I restriction enzyme S subunit|uniref:restriction endonuclease subunit S n=1 Tax=Metallibacterium sp. TaxID=2940281 RepID=UPI0026121820|nr:restriction endonuclease subunit S [Metallibacterium sp.]
MEVMAGYKETELGAVPEDWECERISDAAANSANAIVGGPFGSDLVSADYAAMGVPVIRGQNMAAGVVSGDFVFVSPQKAKSLSANLAHPGDLIFTQRGTLGQVAIVPNDRHECYLVSQSQMKVSLNRTRHDPCFVHQYFASRAGQKQIALSAIQTGVPHTNLGILRAYRFPAPPLPEQRAIAVALSDVDALLGGLDRLIAKKRALKQAAMQQLLTGQTRLPGFQGEWEVKRLGDMLTICHGRNQREVEDASGLYPILATGGQIGTASRALYDKPSVLIGRKGTINQPRYMETPFWTVDTLFYSATKGEHNAKFLYYRFCLIDWMQYNEASGVPSLNARTIESVEVAAPVPAEQSAIASVLTDMDAELAALEARRDKTRALKQAMMQELLTGRTRLVPVGGAHA